MTDNWKTEWLRGKYHNVPPVCGTCRQLAHDSPTITCQGPCGLVKGRDQHRHDKRYPDSLSSHICLTCEAAANKERHADTAKHTPRKRHYIRARRRARKGAGKTYDGITDEQIYERDEWACQMVTCLCPTGRAINSSLAEGPWRRSIDHILARSRGGPDTAANKRAAHLRCNMAVRANGDGSGQFPPSQNAWSKA